jgi:hydroxymethylbilane synthase
MKKESWMDTKIIRIATRKSPLALWQASFVRARLLHYWPDLQIELLPMSTSGDQFLKDKLLAIGGKGLFVKELEDALLEKCADLAVHSMKDVPVRFPEGLTLAVICERASAFDAMVSRHETTLVTLPQGAVVGTSSLRRQSQLLALRPDLHIKGLRGNIHTRLQRMDEGEYDAIVLAVAGLERMELQARISEYIDVDVMLPACGQGALGVECRIEDEKIRALLQPLHCALTARCVETERAVNDLMGGNCHTPLAVYCQKVNDTDLLLSAKVGSVDGKHILFEQQQGHEEMAMQLATRCAEGLMANGAAVLIQQALC